MIPMIDKKTTGQQLKYFMKESGLTPRDIQEYLSLSCVQTVYRWFMGVNIPSIDNLYALSSLFGTSVDALIAGDRPDRESFDRLPGGDGEDADRGRLARLCMYGKCLTAAEAA